MAPGARCSFSTLQKDLIFKIGIDTIQLFPYGYMVSTQTDPFPG